VARVRHHSVKVDLEALREFDPLEIAADRISLAPLLGDGLGLLSASALECRQPLQIASGWRDCWLGEDGRRERKR
jgi:hypothetical protein